MDQIIELVDINGKIVRAPPQQILGAVQADDCVVCDHPVRPHTIRSCDDDCEGRKLRDVLETLPPWAKEAHDVSAARGSR